jgi:hypothetical protein
MKKGNIHGTRYGGTVAYEKSRGLVSRFVRDNCSRWNGATHRKLFHFQGDSRRDNGVGGSWLRRVEGERERIKGLWRCSLEGKGLEGYHRNRHDLATTLSLTGQTGAKGRHRVLCRCTVVCGVIVLHRVICLCGRESNTNAQDGKSIGVSHIDAEGHAIAGSGTHGGRRE